MSFSSSCGSGGGGGRGVGDCVVVFTTDIAAAKEAAQQSAVQWPPACVAVEAHTARLRRASAVFEDMLDGRATTVFKKTVRPHAPLTIMGPGGQQQRVLVVELTTPGQLKQTEVLMRAMYGETLSGDVRHLLGVLTLAAEFKAPKAKKAVATALAALPPEDLSSSLSASILQHMHDVGLWEGLKDDLRRLKTMCIDKLLQVYGDAAYVMNTPCVRAQFVKLPSVAVEAWAGSDALTTDHENTVLRALFEWSAAGDSHFLVCEHVRLAQVSPSFLQALLRLASKLPPEGVSKEEASELIHTAALCCGGGPLVIHRPGIAALKGMPPAWVSTRVRPGLPGGPGPGPGVSEGRRWLGEVGQEVSYREVDAAIKQAAGGVNNRIYGKPVVIAGFALRTFFDFMPSASSPGKADVGVYLNHLPCTHLRTGCLDAGYDILYPRPLDGEDVVRTCSSFLTDDESGSRGYEDFYSACSSAQDLGSAFKPSPALPNTLALAVRVRVTRLDGITLAKGRGA